MAEIERIARELRTYLDLQFPPVGVKLLAEKVEPDHSPGPGTFCYFVRRAMEEGRELTITIDDLSCPSAELALGLRQPRYADIQPRIMRPIKAVRIGPLEGADVVLLLLDPYQVMVLAILLDGLTAEFRGEMALCGDAVARVVNSGQPNITFPCPGARELGGFQRNDVVVGLPYEVMLSLEDRMTKFASLKDAVRGGMSQLLRRL